MTAPSSEPRIEIVVDELVLRGVEPQDANAVAAALESELAVLGAGWAATSPGAVPAARDESFRRLPAVDVPDASPPGVGAAIAGAVVLGMAGARR